MSKEIWLPIPGYEGLYEVSSQGQVRSLPRWTVKRRILKHHLTHDGYPRLMLSKNSLRRMFTVHRLVAVAFLGPPPDGMQVNHKDGNKLNSVLDNLEYVTGSANQRHALAHGLMHKGEAHHNSRLTRAQVGEIRRRAGGGDIKRRIAKDFGMTPTSIGYIAQRRNWKWLEEK